MKELLELLQLKELVRKQIAYNEEGPHSDWKDVLWNIEAEIYKCRNKLLNEDN